VRSPLCEKLYPKGGYDFSAYDKLLGECKQRGISMLGCIALNTLTGELPGSLSGLLETL
jgi:hypothetical protein